MITAGSILLGAVVGWMAARLVGDGPAPRKAPVRNWLGAIAYLAFTGAFLAFFSPSWPNLAGLPLGCIAFVLFRATLRWRRLVTFIDQGSTK